MFTTPILLASKELQVAVNILVLRIRELAEAAIKTGHIEDAVETLNGFTEEVEEYLEGEEGEEEGDDGEEE